MRYSTSCRPKAILLYALLAPAILLTLFVGIIPLGNAFISSFHTRSGAEFHFIGMDHYVRMVNDSQFWRSLQNNLIIVVLCVVGHLVTALLLSCLMSWRGLRLKRLHRFSIFLPVVLSPLVVGFMWRFVYNPRNGVLNAILEGLGLENWIRLWLDDPSIVIYSATIPIIWQFVGMYLVIFLAAMQGISSDILEVAELDGATGFRKAYHIVFPLIYPTMVTALVLSISGNMRVFDQIFSLTGGGPGTASSVLALYSYTQTFRHMNIGYGSTIAIGMLFFSILLIGLSKLIMGRKKDVL